MVDFEADNKFDKSGIGNKTTKVYKQNPLINGYYILSDMKDVLESGYYESLFEYKNVDWFAEEVIKI